MRLAISRKRQLIKLKVRLPTNYGEQTHNSPYWIIRYPHRKRYQLAADALSRDCPRSLLDYGAGDGHVLAELATAGGCLPACVLAYEPDADFARMISDRVAGTALHNAVRVVMELSELDSQERFEFILCLGVMEHMPLRERERFYAVCARHLSPGGKCLIDVPVEVGVSLVIKEAARVLLKGRGREYSTADLLRRLVGRRQRDRARFDASVEDTWIQDHTGFDHRLFREELEARFTVLREFPSPFGKLPASLGNQEMFYLLARRSSRS